MVLRVHCITCGLSETTRSATTSTPFDTIKVQHGTVTAEAVKKRRKRVLKGGASGQAFLHRQGTGTALITKARKSWQMRHAQLSIERAKAAIGYFGNLEVESTVPAEAVTIPNEYIQGLGWGDY